MSNFIKNNNILFFVCLTILTLAVILISMGSQMIPAKCALCQEEVQKISYLEKKLGPWEQIPVLHPACHNYIVKYLAPNCNMTTGEWLEIRGWNPRPEETANKSYQELLDFLIGDE